MNLADLSRTIAVPQTTLKRYFALLEGTFVVQLLCPGSRNLGKRVIQTPEVYLNDTGLLTHMLGASVDRLKTEGNLAGAAFENFVLMELGKQCGWSATRPELSYWRTASGQEVDIVLEDHSGTVVGVEVKAAASLGASDVRGLQALATAVGKKWVRGAIIYTGATAVPFFRQPARHSDRPALVRVTCAETRRGSESTAVLATFLYGAGHIHLSHEPDE